MRRISKQLGAMILGAGLVGGAAMLQLPLASSAQAACEGERVDATTADSARQKMLKAGYTQVRDMRKGCDSVWHAIAFRGGAQVRVLVNPQGQVMEEGD